VWRLQVNERPHPTFWCSRTIGTHALVICLFSVLIPVRCLGKDYLTINSQPPGATVELDGIVVGTTPYSLEIPGAYLHGSHSVFGKLLRHQIHLKLTLDGYLVKEMDLADGPTPWVALNGTNHGDYWILKSATFNVTLGKAATSFTGNIQAALSNSATVTMGPALSTEDIVKNSNAAVLFLSGSEGTGSGFLVSDSGVAVTNAHVARGQETLTATTGNGQSFQAKVVYVDPSLDIALLKLDGSGFPQLRLALTQTVQGGSAVVAIGSPSKGFQNSVTKGIVSGIGQMKSEPGLWIQTDTAINPGNSGGPLLNGAGDVVGITTQKQFLSGDGRPLQGIGFALSSSDLLSVLQKFFPNVTQVQAAQEQRKGKGHVSITADIESADVYIDGKFVGNAPATFTLPSGTHKIEVKDQTGGVWQRDLEVLEDSDVKLTAKLLKK
jgi:S1-C subfamily serine protease